MLSAVAKAGAKLILVGDRRQLQAIGGPGLNLVSRAVEAARIDTIVRQPEAWARDAITSFGQGQAAVALEAFAERNLLVAANGAKSAVSAIIAAADRARALNPDGSCLILAKTNAAVAAISRDIRERHKSAGVVTGKEIVLKASTPSGHTTEIALARGDQIRFLIRNDELGVVNGTIGTVTKVSERRGRASGIGRMKIEAEIAGRRVAFDPTILADGQGRIRIGWAYASTIYGSQGLTVDNAIVYLDPNCNRHDVFVAASRGRATTLVVDAKNIDRRLSAELPFDQQREDAVFSDAQRRSWLAERLSRASTKISTLDVIESVKPVDRHTEQARRRRELGHEL
jgi:ATP-dependent exoDNAse (exonuclease V) alpha subunit